MEHKMEGIYSHRDNDKSGTIRKALNPQQQSTQKKEAKEQHKSGFFWLQ